MKISKIEFENTILFFAELYNLKPNYEALLNSNAGLPKIVEMIVYLLFLNKFSSYGCSDTEYEHYKILLAYVEELNKKGYVTFN